MWANAGDKQSTKKRRVSSESLEHLITERRQRLVEARLSAPELRQRATELRQTADTLTCRFQIRMKGDMLAQATEIEREANIRESMIRESEFDATAERYLTQYREHSNDSFAPADDDTDELQESQDERQIITTPGHRSHQTIDGYVQRARMRESKKHMIVQEYVADIEERPPKLGIRARDVCPFCTQDLFLNSVKSILVCTTCGYSIVHFDSTISSMSYSDDYEFNSFSYKRISHFEDCMKQVQGKESYVVPIDIIESVMRHLHSLRLNKQDITQANVRDALKKLRLRRAYDHVAQVFMRITGRRAPRVSADVEDSCRQMFVRMQPVFETHCPKNRKNFLSYNYVLFRLFYILGLEHMLVGFSLLKGPEKLRLQDEIFERISADLGWKFEPVEQILSRVRARPQ